RHTRSDRDWSSDVCSSDLQRELHPAVARAVGSLAAAALEPRVADEPHHRIEVCRIDRLAKARTRAAHEQLDEACVGRRLTDQGQDRKSTRLNSSHDQISYA